MSTYDPIIHSKHDGIIRRPNFRNKIAALITAFLLVLCLRDGVHSSDGSTVYGSQNAARQLRNEPIRMSPERTCFITASYGNRKEDLDRHFDVTELRNDKDYKNVKFFFFTNIKDIKLDGWHVIVTDLKYKRLITQSRWAKFMGWKHPIIADYCHTIYYMDSIVRPAKPMRYFIGYANKIHNSQDGIAQVESRLNQVGIMKEFKLILRNEKDIQENVDASISWLQSQPDFQEDVTIWHNRQFGYDPRNEKLRKIMEFFWNRYSLEIDSWRDQPLWAYTMHHFNVQPLLLDKNWFMTEMDSKGFGGHTYTKENDFDAATPSDNSF